jgi:dihydrofolate reductase
MHARRSVFIATSLDGFIARPDGRIDWLSVVELPGEAYGCKHFFDSIDTLVAGRKTYETALGFGQWPTPASAAWS